MIDRRGLLMAGGLALGGLTLPRVLAARRAPSDAAVIQLYCVGGMSHLETYDLKPDGPSEMRSVFQPIASRVPGMSLCELLPMQARIAHRFSLVRSLHHKVGIHNDGSITVLTGKQPTVEDPTSTATSEHPDFGMVVSKLRGPSRDGLPPYVAVPYPFPFTRPTYLGPAHAAFGATPNYLPPALVLRGTNPRTLDDRRKLLGRLDGMRRLGDSSRGLDGFRERAFGILTSPAVARAFDLSQESARLRERYGRDLWGQSCLMARRLAEAGTSVVSVLLNQPLYDAEHTNWDDHAGNAMKPGHFAKFMKVRLAYFDRCVSALIEDIAERGLDRRILVVVMTEFGRTPRLRTGPPDASVGRDHWPDAYSALVAGGGLRMGQVVGSTNARGEYPTSQPHTPQDLLAMQYRHLGIDPATELHDREGRPAPLLAHGKPIEGLG